jgi:hypothetical protein
MTRFTVVAMVLRIERWFKPVYALVQTEEKFLGTVLATRDFERTG